MRVIKKFYAFSLIEVLVFTSILSLFFMVAAAVATASLRNMKINEHKILATRYAQELVEWLRGEKEIDWGGNVYPTPPATTFTYKSTQFGNGQEECFNNLDWNDDTSCPYSLNSIFKRTVKFSWDNNSSPIYQINVSITVSWQELGNTYSVPINTVFSVWE